MDNSIDNTAQAQPGSEFEIWDFLMMCLRHWKWFVLSGVVCLGIAALYLSTKSPVYSRSASLLIKEQGKGRSLFSSEMNDFAQMGMFSSNTNVNNELVSLVSPDLLLEVVRRLDLDMNYYAPVPHRPRKQVLYGSSLPVKVEFKDLSYNQGSSFQLRLESDSTLVLSHFTLGGRDFKDAKPVPAQPGEEVMTPCRPLSTASSPPSLTSPTEIIASSGPRIS